MSRQCRGYANSLPIVAPFISGLSTTSSILGATTIVTIFGENFRNYSTVYFGTTLINNVTYFSSGQLSFYVPAIATVGTYPIQVFNESLASNIVEFIIDNSVGFWNQDPATGAITNNNATGGININGQLTVNNPVTLNYQPSLITNNTQLGYQLPLIINGISGASSESYNTIVNNFTPSNGIWLLTGLTTCVSAGSISVFEVIINKVGTVTPIYLGQHTNSGISDSLSYSLTITGNGVDTFYIQVFASTSGAATYSSSGLAPYNTISLTRIA